MEVIDAGMFKESSDNAGNRDIFTDTGNSRSQAANTPYLQINAHSGLRCTVQSSNTQRINECIHFEYDVPVTVVSMP
jgi:hypothetical protein